MMEDPDEPRSAVIATRSTLHDARPDGARPAGAAPYDAPREPSDAELLEIWRDVRKAVTAVDGRLTGSAVAVSAPGAFLHEALAALAAAPDRMAPMAGLAELLGLGPAGCAALVDRMVAAGWALRRHAGADRSVVHVALTEAGAAHERVSTAHHAQQLRVELSVLGPERLTHLREACRLLRAWDPDQAGADGEILASPRGPRRGDLMGLPRTSSSRARHFALGPGRD